MFFLCSFLFDAESDLYQRYRRKVETFRKGVIAESSSRKEEQKKKKKSRWGDESDKVILAQPQMIGQVAGSSAPSGTNPQLIQYAIKVFGTTDLDASQWKQCEDQLKVCLLVFIFRNQSVFTRKVRFLSASSSCSRFYIFVFSSCCSCCFTI